MDCYSLLDSYGYVVYENKKVPKKSFPENENPLDSGSFQNDIVFGKINCFELFRQQAHRLRLRPHP